MRKPFDELLTKHKEETTAPALEILEQIYRILLELPELTLKNGSKVRIEQFDAPRVDADGESVCGFDVRLDDGSHLEFSVRNTGWGKALVPQGGSAIP